MNGINQAIQHFGSRKALADALGLKSSMAVRQWETRQRVPAERAVQIEQLTGGIVKRESLRPDIFVTPAK